MHYNNRGELMNERAGLYVGIIAVLAFAVLALVIYSSIAIVGEYKASDYSSRMLEVKRVWQNARFVLDKTVSEALADYVIVRYSSTGSCSNNVNNAEAENRAKTYIENALSGISAELGTISCTLENFSYAIPAGLQPNQPRIEASVKCSLDTGELKIDYEKEAVFEKEVNVNTAAGCEVTVVDRQSNEIDITQSA